MLVWINGPFGVGKTATALSCTGGCPVVPCATRHVGFGMRGMLPMITPPTTKASQAIRQVIG